jgi:predicted ferric reductase
MTTPPSQKQNTLPPGVRLLLGIFLSAVLLSVVIVFASVPFVFESQTIRYKFGWDKTFLRTGQVLGMIAGTLLFLQLLWASRLQFLDSLFGVKMLFQIHRIAAFCLALFALLHPLFVFFPEDISNLSVELKYWPEMLGGFLLLAVWFLVAVANWRSFLELSFTKWRRLHQINAFIVLVMLFFHVLFVSESFTEGVPKLGLFVMSGFFLLLFAWVRLRTFVTKKNKGDTQKK